MSINENGYTSMLRTNTEAWQDDDVSMASGSSKRRKTEEKPFYAEYNLDDMRRLTRKLLDLSILTQEQIESYVQGDDAVANSRATNVLCMYDSKIRWTTYNIRNQEFTFPHFMKNPVYLSRGGFGTVVKCFRYHEPVAVKKVEVPDEYDSEMALRLLRELVVMKQAKKCNQRHICKIIDVFGDPGVRRPEDLMHIYIIMPLYKPGAMDNVRVKDGNMFRTIAGHTLSALHFLHRHKLMHRDIKKENIFWDEKQKRAYLADLGQARHWHAGEMSGNGEVGTRCYISPEILQGGEYDYKSDVYSLGQTWYEVIALGRDEWCLFPYKKTGGAEHIAMQRALDPRAIKVNDADAGWADRLFGSNGNCHAKWAADRWEALDKQAKEWNDDHIYLILQHTLMFDPEFRADTTRLFEYAYFLPFASEEKIMDLGEVETHDYTVIKKRLFDLQHGSCLNDTSPAPGSPQERKSKYEKMCSRAVQYFNGDGDSDDESPRHTIPFVDIPSTLATLYE